MAATAIMQFYQTYRSSYPTWGLNSKPNKEIALQNTAQNDPTVQQENNPSTAMGLTNRRPSFSNQAKNNEENVRDVQHKQGLQNYQRALTQYRSLDPRDQQAIRELNASPALRQAAAENSQGMQKMTPKQRLTFVLGLKTQLQQQQKQTGTAQNNAILDPTNPNHPNNPANPLNLALNPTGSILFQEDLNNITDAENRHENLEHSGEVAAENREHDQEISAGNHPHEEASSTPIAEPRFDSYKELEDFSKDLSASQAALGLPEAEFGAEDATTSSSTLGSVVKDGAEALVAGEEGLLGKGVESGLKELGTKTEGLAKEADPSLTNEVEKEVEEIVADVKSLFSTPTLTPGS